MTTTNLLPLESLRRVIGLHPFWFWGLADNDKARERSAANAGFRKYAWQNADQLSREDMLEGIVAAENKLHDHLGYWPAPRYAAETLPYPRPYDSQLGFAASEDADGRWLPVKLPDGYLQAIGVESQTLIQTVNVTYSDADGDGLDDTFAASTTATTIETDPAKIAVYFPAAERLDGEGASSAWRIDPVKVTINANGTVAIRGRAWQAVRPVLYEGLGAAGLDPDDADTYVTQVDIYRRTTNPDGNTVATAQAVLTWETAPYPPWCYCGPVNVAYTGSADTDPAATAQGIARCGIRDARRGWVIPGRAVYDAANSVWNAVDWGLYRQPDTVTVRYLAGYALEGVEMARTWQDIVAKLAIAEMPSRLSAKDVGNRAIYHWQFDMSRAAGAGDEQYRISDQDLDNPFGTRRGHVYAWRQVKEKALIAGIAV